jgi:hypothetical protein
MANILPLHYEENDDVAMCAIANGRYIGSPDEHLVFVNVLVGYLLKYLYQNINNIEWYTVFFAFVQIISFSSLLFALYKDERISIVLKIFLYFMVYVLWCKLISYFQFTTIAGISCFSGCVLILSFDKKKYKLLGAVLVFLSFLIRWNASGLVMLLMLPIILASNGINIIKQNFRICFVIFLFCLTAKLIDISHYCSGEWREYSEYNSLRGHINDNNRSVRCLNKYFCNNKFFYDYALLLNFKPDVNVVGVDLLRQFYNYSNDITNCDIVSIKYSFKKYRVYFLVIILLLLLSIYHKKQQINDLIPPLTCFIAVLIISIYLCLMAELKDRVFLCMMFPMFYMFFYNLKDIKFNIVIISVIIICVPVIYKFSKHTIEIHNQSKLFEHEVECVKYLFNGINKPVVYVVDFDVRCINPFNIHCFPAQFVGLGWCSGIPFNKHILMGHDDFIDKEILILSKNIESTNDIRTGIYRNYGIETKFDILKQNHKYVLYKIISKLD